MQRLYVGSVDELGSREVGVVAATALRGRDGHILEPAGVELTNFRKNPICLFQHMADCPVATAPAIGLSNGELAARVQFAPEGASPLADQVCSLVKAGVVRGISVGFNPIEQIPLDKNRPRGGQWIKRSELLELSFVTIPADFGAGVVARSFSAAAFRSLPHTPHVYVQRAAARLSAVRRAAIFSPTMQVWMLMEQRRQDHEATYSYAARKAELSRLSSRA
jgi:HK97 family phage prohead protease